MYQKILIATDGSEVAGKALSHGLALAKAIVAEVELVTVTEMWSAIEMAGAGDGAADAMRAFEEVQSDHAAQILKAAKEQAAAAGVPAAIRHVPDEEPATGIIDAAREAGCDLIVMATHGRRGVSRLLLGSQTSAVITHADIPVLVVR